MTSRMPPDWTILVTGAGGFIGSRLVSHFASRGIRVRAMSRRRMLDSEAVRYVQADAFDERQLEAALQGIDTAYYLLHSMEGDRKQWKDFAAREARQAENFARAAENAGVRRIIYLGGLVNESLELSGHMQSRKRVGEILASSGIPVTELRASIIIGDGGSSHSMLLHLAEKLPVMVCPRWVESATQPIAADDVVEYLAECARLQETAGRMFEIGGPESMSYGDLLRLYGRHAGKTIRIIRIPFLTTRLSSYWVDLVTPVRAALARPLIDSLVHDTVVTRNRITGLIPLRPRLPADAIKTASLEAASRTARKYTKSVPRLGRDVLVALLLLMAAANTSYYWLDYRPDAYAAWWLLASCAWYAVAASAVFFARAGTRLGYLLAGLLSWVSAGFWLLDNVHIAGQESLIAARPDFAMTVRNFAGAAAAFSCIALSHVLFHGIGRAARQKEPA